LIVPELDSSVSSLCGGRQNLDKKSRIQHYVAAAFKEDILSTNNE
jgi:hypothetical protein